MTATPRVVPSIAFSKPPAPGTVLMIDGQRYEVVRTEPYRRKDGRMTTLIVWQSWCPETGHAFELKTGLRTKSINRRCRQHRAPGRPVPPRQKASQARRRRKCGGEKRTITTKR